MYTELLGIVASVIVIIFDFRTVCNTESHTEKDFFDLIFNNFQRM